jgi:hypothetical protein
MLRVRMDADIIGSYWFKTFSKLFTTALLSTVHDSFIPGCFHRRILGMPNPIVN